MERQELKDCIGRYNITIAEAMRRIDSNSCGILFLVDEEDRLVGCITHGDIRRHL